MTDMAEIDKKQDKNQWLYLATSGSPIYVHELLDNFITEIGVEIGDEHLNMIFVSVSISDKHHWTMHFIVGVKSVLEYTNMRCNIETLLKSMKINVTENRTADSSDVEMFFLASPRSVKIFKNLLIDNYLFQIDGILPLEDFPILELSRAIEVLPPGKVPIFIKGMLREAFKCSEPEHP